MLQARGTVNGIFSDLGLEAESLNQLKVVGGVGPGHSVPHTRGGVLWAVGPGDRVLPCTSRACLSLAPKPSMLHLQAERAVITSTAVGYTCALCAASTSDCVCAAVVL